MLRPFSLRIDREPAQALDQVRSKLPKKRQVFFLARVDPLLMFRDHVVNRLDEPRSPLLGHTTHFSSRRYPKRAHRDRGLLLVGELTLVPGCRQGVAREKEFDATSMFGC